VISLPGLGPHGIATESDLISLDHFALVEEFERPLLLQHNDVIGTQNRLRRGLRRHRESQQDNGQRR
jgi:hypothetical protein